MTGYVSVSEPKKEILLLFLISREQLIGLSVLLVFCFLIDHRIIAYQIILKGLFQTFK